MAATPSLRRSWFIAVVAALVVGMAASNPDRPGGSLVLFLALAPLVPVLGVALAYGPGVDPAHEITVSAPLSGFRLVLLRTAAVLATSVVVGGLASMLLVERQGSVAVAWLLPGLSLSLVCLALTTYLAPKTAAWVVSVPWLLVVLMVGERAADPLILFRPPGQALLAVVGLAATAVVIARRRRFDLAAVSS